jgi:hypothetical protein
MTGFTIHMGEQPETTIISKVAPVVNGHGNSPLLNCRAQKWTTQPVPLISIRYLGIKIQPNRKPGQVMHPQNEATALRCIYI